MFLERKMELAFNPKSFYIFLNLHGISYGFLKLKCDGYYKHPSFEMYIVGVLKQKKYTYALEDCFYCF